MKNSVSEQSFYIESDEEDEEKDMEKGEDEDGNGSDSSIYSNDNDNNRQPSIIPSWPQSYRYISSAIYRILFVPSCSLKERDVSTTNLYSWALICSDFWFLECVEWFELLFNN